MPDHLYRERDLILPTLYVIDQWGQATTSQLIGALTELLHPTGHDAEIIANRNDTYFSQKVRNLVSHRGANGMARWTDFTDRVYTLTPAGKTLVEENREALDTLYATGQTPDRRAPAQERILSAPHRRTIVFDENVPISEGARTATTSVARQRSARLRQAALRHYTAADGSITCAVCGFDFRRVYGALGESYIQLHHEIPLSQYADEGLEQFLPQAMAHIKPLCANCHVMIHRNRAFPLTLDQLRAQMGL